MSRRGWVGYLTCTIVLISLAFLAGSANSKPIVQIEWYIFRIVLATALGWPINVSIFCMIYQEEPPYFARKARERYLAAQLVGVSVTLLSLLYSAWVVYQATRA